MSKVKGERVLGGQNAIWVVVKIMVPFWIPIIIRHLIFRAPKKETIILTTTHIGRDEKDTGFPIERNFYRAAIASKSCLGTGVGDASKLNHKP